ncbi:MAG TPA: hypothetical protein VGO93_00935 [Candidatus Xenobia bacterium]|jgi:hypothetical protein
MRADHALLAQTTRWMGAASHAAAHATDSELTWNTRKCPAIQTLYDEREGRPGTGQPDTE